MKKTILILTLIFATNLMAQRDTLYFNSAWNKVNTKNEAAYYRPIPLEKVGNLYQVKDYYSNGNLQMEGFWTDKEKEILQGKVIWYYENGKIEEIVNYKDEYLHGKTSYYTKEGFLRATGEYKGGQAWNGTIRSRCCPKRVTKYNEGTKIAYLTFYKELDQLAKKEIFKDGKISKIQYFDKKGRNLGEISYKDDEAVDGKFVWFIMDNDEALSIESSISYQNGKRNGECLFFREGKTIAKGIYKDDKPWDGTFYNENDNTITSYKNGIKHGLFIQYDNEGKIKSQQEFDQGKLSGKVNSRGYFKDRTCSCIYKEGEPFTGELCEDLSVLSYTNGKIIKRETYKRESQDTIEEEQYYNENGEVAKKTTYYKGKQYELTYKDGKPYEGQTFSEYNNALFSYKKGHLNGPFIENTYQGVEIKGNYKNDLWEGTLTFDDLLHHKTTSCNYKNGKPFNGTIIENNCITNYKNGLKTGLEKCKATLYFKINNEYTLVYDSITQNYKNDKLDGKVLYFKAGTLVNQAVYEQDHKIEGVFYINKVFENEYKQAKLVKSTYYADNYRIVDTFKDYLVIKETTYKDDKIIYEGNFKNGAEYNGTFITIDDKEEPRRLTCTTYKNGKKYGKEQTVNFIENKVEGVNFYKNGIIQQQIKTFPFKNKDSIVGFYKKGKPFSGHFYSKKSTIEKIAHYKKGIKTGYQYYYSTTGSLLKPVLDSINYKEGKPFDGIDINVINKDYHTHFYKNGKWIQTEVYDIYYQGINDLPTFHITPTSTGFITKKLNEGTFEKYNELIFANKEKTEGKVVFYGENEKGYLQFKNSKLIDVQIEVKIPYVSFTIYLEKPNTLVADAKFEDLQIKMYPEFKLSSSPSYNDFLAINKLFFKGSGVAHFYLDNKLLSTCTIKKGKGGEGIVIKQMKNGKFIYREYKEGESIKTRKWLTKEELLELLKTTKN